MSGGLDVPRREQLAELRDLITRAPLAFRRELKHGPRAEPNCGVCAAYAAGHACQSYAEALADYHDVGVFTFAELVDGELEEVAAMVTDEAAPLIRALADALAAERALTLYLLAGWTPPRIRRPA